MQAYLYTLRSTKLNYIHLLTRLRLNALQTITCFSVTVYVTRMINPAYGIYMEGLILGINTLYRLFCFFKLFLIGCIGLKFAT